MDTEDLIKLERETSHRLNERVQFYSLTLAFTLLALSIQTAKFSECNIQIGAEIGGWFLLIISGTAGFYRMNKLPRLYKLSSLKRKNLVRLAKAKKYKFDYGNKSDIYYDEETMKEVDVNEYITKHQKWYDGYKEESDNLRKTFDTYKAAHYGSFFIGLILIMFSRAYIGLY